MVTIEKRGNNSYRLIVSCGYDSNNKKILKRKTITLPSTMTEREIERELTIEGDKFEKEVQRGTYLDGNITLNEFAEKWLKDYAETNLKPLTLARYKVLLGRILIALGHKKLDSIQPTHLMEFYRNLGETGIRLDYVYTLKENIINTIPDFEKKVSSSKVSSRTIKDIIKGKGTNIYAAEKICKILKKPVHKIFDVADKNKTLSSLTIRHHHRVLSAMLTTAVQWQLIMSNPCERVKPPKVERKEAHYYSIDETERLLELLENESIKYRTMIHIVIFCGLRLGEVTNLEWTDVDFEEKTITISKQLQYLPEFGTYELESTKTESGNRTISIDSTLADLLREYKAWQDEEKIKLGDKWINSNKLFTQDNGTPIFPYSPSHWFNRFIKRNNLPPLTFHQLRHTNASLLIGQGVDVATVSRRLGHADKTITLKIYAHAIKEHDREAADALGNLLNKKKK